MINYDEMAVSTHEPESHVCKDVDEWLFGSGFPSTKEPSMLGCHGPQARGASLLQNRNRHSFNQVKLGK